MDTQALDTKKLEVTSLIFTHRAVMNSLSSEGDADFISERPTMLPPGNVGSPKGRRATLFDLDF